MDQRGQRAASQMQCNAAAHLAGDGQHERAPAVAGNVGRRLAKELHKQVEVLALQRPVVAWGAQDPGQGAGAQVPCPGVGWGLRGGGLRAAPGCAPRCAALISRQASPGRPPQAQAALQRAAEQGHCSELVSRSHSTPRSLEDWHLVRLRPWRGNSPRPGEQGRSRGGELPRSRSESRAMYLG